MNKEIKILIGIKQKVEISEYLEQLIKKDLHKK